MTHLGTPKSDFIKKIFKHSVKKICDTDQGIVPIDLFAMAVALDGSVGLKIEEVYAEIEVAGHMTRGQLVVDYRKRLNMAPNIRIVKDYDLQKLTSMTMNTLM